MPGIGRLPRQDLGHILPRMTEVWVRNPVTCIRECAELLFPRIVWDRGYATKQRIDPKRHLELHYPTAVGYRILMVGEQGAAEITRDSSMAAPAAVYPVWVYGEQMIPELEAMMANQVLPDGKRPDERGVAGQEHRVVITSLPAVNTHAGKAVIRTLKQLQDEYPDCILHIHGLYSWKAMFGYGWGAADVDPVATARRGKLSMPGGGEKMYEKADTQWISMLGYTQGQLASPQERTKFNIHSAIWAGDNFTSDLRFRVRDDGTPVDSTTPKKDYKPKTVRHTRAPRATKEPGDKLLCDKCSLAPACKLYREGGVCIVSGTDGSGLAKHFGTRDADEIMDGLGKVLQEQTKRFEKGVESEERSGDIDPEVTKIGNSVFQMGVKLAQLIDPSLAKPGVQVNVGISNHNGQARVAELENTPPQMIAALVQELQEQHNIPLESITPAMIAEFLISKNRKEIDKITAIEASTA